MKKRLLSLLLTVCMVVMLFTGLAATASAADTIKGYLVSYTLQAGDTMNIVPGLGTMTLSGGSEEMLRRAVEQLQQSLQRRK